MYVHSFDTEDLMLGILHIRKKSSVVHKSRILSSLLVGQLIVVTTIFLSIILSQ